MVDALPVPLTDTIFGDLTPAPLLISLAELSVWVQETLSDDDAFAREILYAASEKVRWTARQPMWDAKTAPPRARQICAHLAARSYKNPDSITSEGNLGPLGGDRTVEELAKALHLTVAETEELQGLAPAGSLPGSGGMWVQPINAHSAAPDGDIYLRDSSGSDWMLPYLNERDYPALG